MSLVIVILLTVVEQSGFVSFYFLSGEQKQIANTVTTVLAEALTKAKPINFIVRVMCMAVLLI